MESVPAQMGKLMGEALLRGPRRKRRMSGSEYAAMNPLAVIDSLERAARCTWRELQRHRKELRGLRRGYMERSVWWMDRERQARQEWWTLRMLLNIRRGIE